MFVAAVELNVNGWLNLFFRRRHFLSFALFHLLFGGFENLVISLPKSNVRCARNYLFYGISCVAWHEHGKCIKMVCAFTLHTKTYAVYRLRAHRVWRNVAYWWSLYGFVLRFCRVVQMIVLIFCASFYWRVKEYCTNVSTGRPFFMLLFQNTFSQCRRYHYWKLNKKMCSHVAKHCTLSSQP